MRIRKLCKTCNSRIEFREKDLRLVELQKVGQSRPHSLDVLVRCPVCTKEMRLYTRTRKNNEMKNNG